MQKGYWSIYRFLLEEQNDNWIYCDAAHEYDKESDNDKKIKNMHV